MLVVALLTFVATAWLFVAIPKGFFPRGGHRADPVTTEAAEDTSFPEMVRLQEQAAAIFRADPNVAAVSSFNGGSGAQNTGRMFITLKPRGERQPMKQVIEGLRRKLREVAGINVFMRPIQNLQLGGRPSKAQYQYILQSVQADELNDWAVKLQDKLRTDPLFRDVTSDAQLRGAAGAAQDRPRPRQLAGRVDRRDPHRACTAPSASARSPPSTCPPTATR